MVDDEPKGLVLWGGVDVDVSLPQLQKKRCGVCGGRAAYASRGLEEQGRTFLCSGCAAGRLAKGAGTGSRQQTT